MDLDNIMNILSDKINNTKLINKSLIEELCMGLRLYCQNHNTMINDWFDEQYKDNLLSLKKNNDNYSKLQKEYEYNSFVFVDKF